MHPVFWDLMFVYAHLLFQYHLLLDYNLDLNLLHIQLISPLHFSDLHVIFITHVLMPSKIQNIGVTTGH